LKIDFFEFTNNNRAYLLVCLKQQSLVAGHNIFDLVGRTKTSGQIQLPLDPFPEWLHHPNESKYRRPGTVSVSLPLWVSERQTILIRKNSTTMPIRSL